MISKSVLLLSSLMLFAMAVADTNVKNKKVTKLKKQRVTQFSPHSCLDYLEKGYKRDGFYKIFMHDIHGSTLTVYCDMNSEAGAAWTLVESFALKNARMTQFISRPLKTNAPVNEKSPNWNLYRMTLDKMNHVKSQSTHWRATCSFPTHGVDCTDYVRAKFADFDVVTFMGVGVCKKVEYVNIRGHRCAHCTSKWWQQPNYAAHIDSTSPGCNLNARLGSTFEEDNFGHSNYINSKFRCTSGRTSTTNWWFGGYQ